MIPNSLKYIVFMLLGLPLLIACDPIGLNEVEPNAVYVFQGATKLTNQRSVIDFGVLKAKESAQKSFKVINNGSASLNISQITSDNGEFVVKVEKDTLQLAPKASLSFTITYTPREGGTSFGKISFKTNDPAFPVFSFQVKAVGLIAPKITGNGSVISGDLNTVDMGNGNLGTRFEVEIYVEDPSNQIDVENFKLVLEATMEKGAVFNVEKLASEVETSPDKKRMKFSIAALFADSNYVDVAVKIVLPNGEQSNIHTVRIEKPQGAN